MAAKGAKKKPRAKRPAKTGQPVKAVTKPAAKPAKVTKTAKTAAKDAKNGGPSKWWEASVQFLREVKTELKKVAWPSRRQTISSTGVVLALVFIVAAFLGLVDMILSRLIRLVVG